MAKFIDCQDLLLGKKCPPKIEVIVYKSCVRSARFNGSEIWCLGYDEIGILQRTERAMVRSMCEVKLVDQKLAKDLMQMLDFFETTDQLTKCPSVWTCVEKT